jgi:hypothetical protein
VRAGERRATGQERMERRAEGPDVGRWRGAAPHRLFGGHVLGGAEDLTGDRQFLDRRRIRLRRQAGDSEVEQSQGLGHAQCLRQHEILGLEVAVDHPLRVRFGQRAGDGPHERKRPLRGEGTAGSKARRHVRALDELEAPGTADASSRRPNARTRTAAGWVDAPPPRSLRARSAPRASAIAACMTFSATGRPRDSSRAR